MLCYVTDSSCKNVQFLNLVPCTFPLGSTFKCKIAHFQMQNPFQIQAEPFLKPKLSPIISSLKISPKNTFWTNKSPGLIKGTLRYDYLTPPQLYIFKHFTTQTKTALIFNLINYREWKTKYRVKLCAHLVNSVVLWIDSSIIFTAKITENKMTKILLNLLNHFLAHSQ